MNAMHPVFANRGYQHGRVVLISTHTGLTSMASGVFVGIAVLDEAWPTRPAMFIARVLAFLCMITGVCSMNIKSIKSIRLGKSILSGDDVEGSAPRSPSLLATSPGAQAAHVA